MNRRALTTAVLFIVVFVTVACGKKGAPLAPLYLVPGPVSDVSARRAEDAIRLRFVLPAKNVNGPGINLDRVEIYAVTVAPGEEAPPNRELLTKPYLAGQVQVKPAPVEGAPDTPEDKRPGPGDAVIFAEQLSSLPPPPRRRVTKKPTKTPQPSEPAVAPGSAAAAPETTAAAAPSPGATPPEVATPPAEQPTPAAGPTPPLATPAAGQTTPPTDQTTPPAGQTTPSEKTPASTPAGAQTPPGTPPAQAAAAAAAAAAKITQPTRIYMIRGVARNGRSGPPSARIAVPLKTTLDAPGGVKAQNTEKAIVVEWLPAVATVAGAKRTYNVYKADGVQDEPLNAKPLDSPAFEQASAELGTEVCFRVRAVEASGPVLIESPLSEPACVTPKDVFAPAVPKGLATVATPGAIQLIWDANTESDLGGYIVLRAEAPDEKLQPLTPAPIRDTVFKDATVTPGVRYLYAIVAVDSATPPNRSEPSERVEAIAR